jgi:hypothetical protein
LRKKFENKIVAKEEMAQRMHERERGGRFGRKGQKKGKGIWK